MGATIGNGGGQGRAGHAATVGSSARIGSTAARSTWRPATSTRRARAPATSRRKIVKALAKFFFLFGVWPTQWEYVEWRKLQVDAWRRSGQADRRLPNLKQIRKAFDDFDRALAVARAWAADDEPSGTGPVRHAA
jgi:hypothetical protein